MLKNSSLDWYRKMGRVNQPRTYIRIGTANGGTSFGSFGACQNDGPALIRRIIDVESQETALVVGGNVELPTPQKH